MLNRVGNGLLQLALNLLQTTNVVPGSGRNLDDSLTKRRGVVDTEGIAEVLHGDAKGVENFGVNRVLIEIDEVHLLADLLHGSL